MGDAAAKREARGATIAALTASAVVLTLLSCASSGCREFLTGSKESPNRAYTAGSFVRKCGGEQGGSLTHVNLHDGMGTPPPGLNGTITSGEVFAAEGSFNVKLTWKGNGELLVGCEGCAGRKVTKRESAWRDVKISYAEK
ncbi:MAG TPA: hypothetical protein VD968_13180 [Pyrinomonadaceae bacterium]|nr:hypothetical protein [Pyrinomonadaceae bacterium]